MQKQSNANLIKKAEQLNKGYSQLCFLERKLSSTNFNLLIGDIFEARKKFVEFFGVLKSCLERQEFIPVSVARLLCWERAIYVRNGEDYVDLSLIEANHELVKLRVDLIESWFRLKKTSYDSPLYLTRKAIFIKNLSAGVAFLNDDIDYAGGYELYAEDRFKLNSLIYSYFNSRSKESYIVQFNKLIGSDAAEDFEMAILLKEFGVFYSYKPLSG